MSCSALAKKFSGGSKESWSNTGTIAIVAQFFVMTLRLRARLDPVRFVVRVRVSDYR